MRHNIEALRESDLEQSRSKFFPASRVESNHPNTDPSAELMGTLAIVAAPIFGVPVATYFGVKAVQKRVRYLGEVKKANAEGYATSYQEVSRTNKDVNFPGKDGSRWDKEDFLELLLTTEQGRINGYIVWRVAQEFDGFNHLTQKVLELYREQIVLN